MSAVRDSICVVALVIAGSLRLWSVDSLDSIKAKIDQNRIDPIEGIWQMTPQAGSGLFSVTAVPGRTDEFDIILYESPDWRIPFGTVCGKAFTTSERGVYDCQMASKPGETRSFGAYTATMTLSDEGRRMVFKPYKKKISVNFRHWLPYFFRISIKEDNTRPDNLEGALRIYPVTPGVRPIKL